MANITLILSDTLAKGGTDSIRRQIEQGFFIYIEWPFERQGGEKRVKEKIGN